MNLALEQCEEIISDKVTQQYGDVYIRGNNGKFKIINFINLINNINIINIY